ncbi:MAG TPA: DNA mismatch repair protein MutS [Sedimenticola thiotaurini]|uniref:DNA mismatch repair protein MutS n=1 Tax=Sedimenticola thiotaurini TaxID=1543721 RepID=A0A831RI13_9GAMM|nr:DNA mismatch repair protein MutS [Sedimenticola thiotaurini]
MSKRPPAPDDDETELFRREMASATPLRHDRAEPFRRRLPPVPLPPRPGQESDPGDDLRDLNIETGDELLFMRPGVQNRLFQELRRGHLPPQESLDLHGLRVAEARSTLARFLAYARHHRLRVVHIIHGKGFGSEGRQPILKQKVNQWLRQRREVLAFCSAPRFDGGMGAVYVLLSRKAEP